MPVFEGTKVGIEKWFQFCDPVQKFMVCVFLETLHKEKQYSVGKPQK